MKFLVGYTGFVGSNIAQKGQFDGLYNSKNVHTAYGKNPDILYYSAVPAQKFMANKFPQEDYKIIENAIENIKKINPKKIVLISTVDVYKNPNGKDENCKMEKEDLQPYGLNRLILEEMVMQNFSDYHIIRLPGLYGENLKKNFIYDFINFIPSLLTEEKFCQLINKDENIEKMYIATDNGFYKYNENFDRNKAKKILEKVGFSALNFTDTRAVYQFYNLEYLYDDIQKAIDNNIKVLNIATQGVSVHELYKFITGKDFENHISENFVTYDFKTMYDKLFGGKNGYMQDKDFVLNDIKRFVEEKMRKEG